MAGLPSTVTKQQRKNKKEETLFSKELRIPFLPEVPEKQLIEFTRNLAVMLTAKLTLLKALETCIEQTTHARFNQILSEVKNEVRKGKNFSDAIAKYTSQFDGIYIQLTKVGEVTGILDQVLLRLAGYKEKAFKLKQSIRMALVYPAIILTVAFAAVTFLLVFVVPTFVDMYRDFEAELPGPTQAILLVSDFLTTNSLVLLATLIGIVVFSRFYLTTAKGIKFRDQLTLNIPYFGTMYKKGLIGQFANTLSTLLHSGVTLTESLKVLSATATNSVLQEEVVGMLNALKKGKSLNKTITTSSIFPVMVTQMISVGEETASLDDMLKQIAVMYEEEVDLMVEGLTSVIEPILIVFIGLIVGAIIVALYLPIFEMVNVIG